MNVLYNLSEYVQISFTKSRVEVNEMRASSYSGINVW